MIIDPTAEAILVAMQTDDEAALSYLMDEMDEVDSFMRAYRLDED